MLDKKLIKIHQVLLGLFKGNTVLSSCRKGLPELHKALLMAAAESSRKMTKTNIKIKAVAISASFLAALPLLPLSTFSSSRFFFSTV